MQNSSLLCACTVYILGQQAFGRSMLAKKDAPKRYDQMKKEPDLSNLAPKKISESFDEN